MQHHVHDREVDAGLVQRQVVHVALAHLQVAMTVTLEVVARDRQHAVTEVDADAVTYLWRQDLEDTTGAGTDIE